MHFEKGRLVTHQILFCLSGMALIITSSAAWGQPAPEQQPKKTTEPVFRVSKLVNNAKPTMDVENAFGSNPLAAPAAAPPAVAPPAVTPPAATPPKHPLDQAVTIAHEALANMRAEIRDYSAILVKRESVNGVLSDPGYILLKVRCPRETENGKVPFSIYMKFLRPRESAGREVIWIEGQNNGKLIVHEGRGLLGRQVFHLDPTGHLAMKGNRYPIYEAGLENLIVKLIEKAERDRAAGPCKVIYRDGAVINKRPCKLIELQHDDKKPCYEFHKAQVFIDQEMNIPVRYAAYDWPSAPGGKPRLIEEYTYVNIKTNIGLTDLDFSPANPAYKFRR